MRTLRNLSIIVVVLSFCACQKFCTKSYQNMTPEEIVETYLNIALNMQTVEEKDKLLALTRGELHDAIATASDEAIRQAYINKQYELHKYVLIERLDRTPRETEITYSLEYRNLAKESENDPFDKDSAPYITVEKTVRVMKDDDGWKITEVIASKSSLDFPISLTPIVVPSTSGKQ